MTDVWWQVGQPRLGKLWPPLEPDHAGYFRPCLLCPRNLGGQGTQALPVREIAVGPAAGDAEAVRLHEAGEPYRAAAVVVHDECIAPLNSAEVEHFVAGLVMTRFHKPSSAAS